MKTITKLGILLLAALLFLGGRITANENFIPIERNQAWNAIVRIIERDNDMFRELNAYLKEHETEPKLGTMNVKALNDIKDLKADHKRIIKELEKIEREVKEGAR